MLIECVSSWVACLITSSSVRAFQLLNELRHKWLYVPFTNDISLFRSINRCLDSDNTLQKCLAFVFSWWLFSTQPNTERACNSNNDFCRLLIQSKLFVSTTAHLIVLIILFIPYFSGTKIKLSSKLNMSTKWLFWELFLEMQIIIMIFYHSLYTCSSSSPFSSFIYINRVLYEDFWRTW